MKQLKMIIAGLLFLSPLMANADPISIGALSSNDDGSTEVITDSLYDREWLRWDVVNGLTYAELQEAFDVGGAYEGWRIAGLDEMFDFFKGLVVGRYLLLRPNYRLLCRTRS